MTRSIRRHNLVGKIFGRLLVVSFLENRKGSAFWLCVCSCGNNSTVSTSQLNQGTISCGCYRAEMVRLAIKKYNRYDLSGNYGVGYTDKGFMFYFDKEDYDKIKDYCWYMLDSNEYVTTTKGNKKLKLHSFIMNILDQTPIDHKNHDVFDNRKENLRICTPSQNEQNKKIQKHTSRYKGVFFDKYHKKWKAQIEINGKHIFIGYFNIEEDAALAYNNAAIKYFKEFAYLNIIE
jgi:hypothetical protein